MTDLFMLHFHAHAVRHTYTSQQIACSIIYSAASRAAVQAQVGEVQDQLLRGISQWVV
jgi:hypothetical protein